MRGKNTKAKPLLGARRKSSGRVAAMRRLNQAGLRGPGGRMPAHGMRTLKNLLQRGADPETPVGRLLVEREGRYVTDLGGESTLSAMELGLVHRLAEVDLFIALVRARLLNPNGGPRRLP